jgi:hypothetical protein
MFQTIGKLLHHLNIFTSLYKNLVTIILNAIKLMMLTFVMINQNLKFRHTVQHTPQVY